MPEITDNSQLTEDQMNELYLKPDEYKLSKLVKKFKKIKTIMEGIYKQSKINPACMSKNTVDTMILYLEILDEMYAEIKMLLLRNTYLLPESINISNYDEWAERGGSGVCDRWDIVNGGIKQG